MKKRIIVFIGVLAMVMLAACSGSQSPVKDGVFTTTADEFKSKFETVISSDERFSSLEVQGSSKDKDEYIYIAVAYNGEVVGIAQFYKDGKSAIFGHMASYSSSFELSDVETFLTACCMALDSSLTYDDAYQMIENFMSSTSGTSISKNGVQYTCGLQDSVFLIAAQPDENTDDN